MATGKATIRGGRFTGTKSTKKYPTISAKTGKAIKEPAKKKAAAAFTKTTPAGYAPVKVQPAGTYKPSEIKKTAPGPAITSALKSTKQRRTAAEIVQKAQAIGIKKTEDIKLSGLSTKAYQATQRFARTTRKGAPVLQQKISVVSPTTGKIIRYPIESVVRGVEMAGMVPGGLEVMARRPGVIPAAVTVGAYQATVGTAKAAKADPKQFVSDVATLGLLMKGAGKVPKPSIKKVGVRTKALAKAEAAEVTFAKPKVSEASFNRFFAKAKKQAEAEAGRTLTKSETATFKQSIRKNQMKELADIATREGKQKARQENTLAKQMAKQFEKQRVKQEAVKTKAKVESETPIKVKKATVTNIRAKEQALARKAQRLQGKYETGRIAEPFYKEQRSNILKQANDLETLRKDAIEYHSVAGRIPRSKQFKGIKPIIGSKLFAGIVPSAAMRQMSGMKQVPRKVPSPTGRTRTRPATKAPQTVKAFTGQANAVRRTMQEDTKPKVSEKQRKVTRIGIKEEMPLPMKLPKGRGTEEEKKKMVKRRVTRKEYTPFQIKNQIAGLSSLFG
jgi:hypothetical protein